MLAACNCNIKGLRCIAYTYLRLLIVVGGSRTSCERSEGVLAEYGEILASGSVSDRSQRSGVSLPSVLIRTDLILTLHPLFLLLGAPALVCQGWSLIIVDFLDQSVARQELWKR